MTDRKGLSDTNEPPEDVASLYSWANLHGAKYRDFSTARAQSREKARQRVQQVIDEERERTRQQPELPPEAEKKTTEPLLTEEQADLAELATKLAAQLVARQAKEQAAEQAARKTAEVQAQSYAPTHQPPAWRETRSEAFAPAAFQAGPRHTSSGVPTTQGFLPASSFIPLREEAHPSPLAESSGQTGSREVPERPAWLTEKPEVPAAPFVPQSPRDTIQGSRERLTSRWFALKSLMEGAPAQAPEAVPAPAPARAPVMAVFSLAGGVGKSSLAATLGRALSARGERVLLVDTSAFGLLPFFFGAHDQRPGQLRTFNPPAISGDSPIQLIAVDPDSLGPENAAQEILTTEISRYSQGVSRILIDLATASGATARRILKLSPLVLIPAIPDMNSVVSVGSIDAFFEHSGGTSGKLPYYVLNQFDSSLPLHIDVREVLREQLGDRLLPFALRRSPAVSEALAEGMTVIDYAPNSTIAEDYSNLVGWVKSLSAPASIGFRGVRWSER